MQHYELRELANNHRLQLFRSFPGSQAPVLHAHAELAAALHLHLKFLASLVHPLELSSSTTPMPSRQPLLHALTGRGSCDGMGLDYSGQHMESNGRP